MIMWCYHSLCFVTHLKIMIYIVFKNYSNCWLQAIIIVSLMILHCMWWNVSCRKILFTRGTFTSQAVFHFSAFYNFDQLMLWKFIQNQFFSSFDWRPVWDIALTCRHQRLVDISNSSTSASVNNYILTFSRTTAYPFTMLSTTSVHL